MSSHACPEKLSHLCGREVTQLIFSSGPVFDILARFSAALKVELVSSVSDIFRAFFAPFAFRNSAFVAVDALPQIHHRQKVSQNAILQFVR